MKQPFWGLHMLLIVTGISVARGQSGNVINFSNRDIARGINAPFYDADGITRLSGSNYRAALYWGPSQSPESMVLLGASQPFLTGSSAGYWSPANLTIVAPFPGQPIFVQVRFWDSQGGAHPVFEAARAAGAKVGFSEVLQLTPPLSGTIPLTGLKSARLIDVVTNITLGETRTVIDVMNVPSGLQLGALCAMPVGRMRWFNLTFANPGDAMVSTEGSSIDTALAVFTSCLLSPNACVPVACSSNEVRFRAQTNVTYAVAVGGKNDATGELHLAFSMPVALAVERTADNKINISWPAEATEFGLEVTTNLSPPAWQPADAPPNVSSNRNWVRLPADGSGRFYRLNRTTR